MHRLRSAPLGVSLIDLSRLFWLSIAHSPAAWKHIHPVTSELSLPSYQSIVSLPHSVHSSPTICPCCCEYSKCSVHRTRIARSERAAENLHLISPVQTRIKILRCGKCEGYCEKHLSIHTVKHRFWLRLLNERLTNKVTITRPIIPWWKTAVYKPSFMGDETHAIEVEHKLVWLH